MKYLTTTVSARHSPHLSAKNLGTGNVLFQVASIYGIAKEYGRSAEFTSIVEYCNHIKSLYGYNHLDTLYRSCISAECDYSRVLHEHELEKKVDDSLLGEIERNAENIQIHGYLECPSYFHKYRDEIVSLLSPDVTSLLHISNEHPELFSRTCVFIHVRTGSDANTLCGVEYYRQAVRFINKRVEDPFYFVVSDGDVDVGAFGIQSCKKIHGNQDYIDLWIMSLCRHAITCYSTFSWWGSYLIINPNKIVTYPRSALLYIQSRNGDTETNIHTGYFLSGTQIKDS